MKKPTTMNSKPNILTGRCDLLQSPPPLTDVNIINSSSYKAKIPALLNSVYTRVGRALTFRRACFRSAKLKQDSLCPRLIAALSCICLAALPLLMGSCQQDEAATEDALHANMLQYYAESQGLIDTSADSVCNYYTKFAGFHNQHPECEADELFPPTIQNLDNAFTKYGIVQIGDIIVKTEWEGETYINF